LFFQIGLFLTFLQTSEEVSEGLEKALEGVTKVMMMMMRMMMLMLMKSSLLFHTVSDDVGFLMNVCVCVVSFTMFLFLGQHVRLLVWVNKQDLPDAMSAADVTQRLDLQALASRHPDKAVHWHVQECSALKGTGIQEVSSNDGQSQSV
jgi:hypothetical protein